MKTITFYSYKGGTGRSLALANAARYLARLGFKVVALDFDLEAPGLHYKFSTSPSRGPIPVKLGIADYIHSFIVEGVLPRSLDDFVVAVSVPGVAEPLVHLIPAGAVPSLDYWSKLSRINWHDLFYSKDAEGVQLFLELKSRISDELNPDFLLIDARTGITEMGGVATTLLADMVICLVLPTLENLEGARAILRSLGRSQREGGGRTLEIVVALSRVPREKDSEDEHAVANRILAVLNQEADDLKDTLSCPEIFILHREAGLEVEEALRVGSGISPDESILLTDYLRLFANIVPKESIEPRVGRLIQQAKDKIWVDPEAALREMEELAESFGHPEHYRALLQFYEVRNVSGPTVLKRAQQLWKLTEDSGDVTLWQIVKKSFEPTPRWRRGSQWSPDLQFIEAVWRDAGKRDPGLGVKVAEAHYFEDRVSHAADVMLEIVKTSGADAAIVSRCIDWLDAVDRVPEAETLIRELKAQLIGEPGFVEAWARHALRTTSKDALLELTRSPAVDTLVTTPVAAMLVFVRSGLVDQAGELADRVLSGFGERAYSESEIVGCAEAFDALGRGEEFKKVMGDRFPPGHLEELVRRRQLFTRRRK